MCLVFTEKSKFIFDFILFRRYTVNREFLEPKDKGLFVTEYLDQLSYSCYD